MVTFLRRLANIVHIVQTLVRYLLVLGDLRLVLSCPLDQVAECVLPVGRSC